MTFPQSLDGLEDLEDLEEGFSEENLQMIVSMDGKDLETALAASKTTILWPAPTSNYLDLQYVQLDEKKLKIWIRAR